MNERLNREKVPRPGISPAGEEPLPGSFERQRREEVAKLLMRVVALHASELHAEVEAWRRQ